MLLTCNFIIHYTIERKRQMPIITVKLVKGRTVEQKQRFVEAVTKEAVKILDVKEEWVTVLFEEYDRENWASSGKIHSLKYGEGFGKKGAEFS